jgi:hypothetical protein
MDKNKNKPAPITINWKKLLLPLIGFIIGTIAFLWIAKRIIFS